MVSWAGSIVVIGNLVQFPIGACFFSTGEERMLPATLEDDLSESGWNPTDLGLVDDSEASAALGGQGSTALKATGGSSLASVSSISATESFVSVRSHMSSTGRRALSNSIRHHAAILQHKAVDKKIDVDDPTEGPSRSQEQFKQRFSETLDDQAITGSDWNFFTPPAIPSDWTQRILTSAPRLSRKWVILLTVFAFLVSITLATMIGLHKSGFQTEPSSLGVKQVVGTAIQSISATISGISQTSSQLQDANIILPSFVEENLGRAGTGVIPFFLFAPQTGGLTLQRLTRECLGLVEASGAGSQDMAETTLTVKFFPVGGGKYLNVDMTTIPGLERARNLQLANSGLVNILYSPLFYPVTEKIFDANYTGRMFTLVRHPVSRAIAVYLTTPNPAGISIDQYIHSGQLENNYLTRVLINKLQGDLVKEDLEIALDTLRRKFIIGLSDRLSDSLERFRHFFGWPDYDANKAGCLDTALSLNDELMNQTISVQGDNLWNAVLLQNNFDVQVYEYAKVLYDEQSPGTR